MLIWLVGVSWLGVLEWFYFTIGTPLNFLCGMWSFHILTDRLQWNLWFFINFKISTLFMSAFSMMFELSMRFFKNEKLHFLPFSVFSRFTQYNTIEEPLQLSTSKIAHFNMFSIETITRRVLLEHPKQIELSLTKNVWSRRQLTVIREKLYSHVNH